MPEGQRHLTHEERCRIGALKESGLSDGAVAAHPGRDRPSVWRELRRNGGDSGYSPGEGRGKAEARRGGASSVPRKMTAERRAHVETWLTEGWSPEQTAGRLRLEGGWAVSRQWTSGYLKADRKAGGGLFPLLRRRGKKPNWRGGRHSGRGHIPGRVDISERPEGGGQDFDVASVRAPVGRRPCAARKAPIGSPAKGLQPSRARNHRRQGAGNPAFRPFSPPGRGKWPVLHFGLEVGVERLSQPGIRTKTQRSAVAR